MSVNEKPIFKFNRSELYWKISGVLIGKDMQKCMAFMRQHYRTDSFHRMSLEQLHHLFDNIKEACGEIKNG